MNTQRAMHDFDALYAAGVPPWDIGKPQQPLVAVADAGLLRGNVLDVGCGTGEHALLAASRGHEAVGIDIAAKAIAMAQEKAEARRLSDRTRFIVGDALELRSLGEQFDTVLDCGLFHIFDDESRARFVTSLHDAVVPGGRYFMLSFSEHQPGDWGPRRVTQDEIRTAFAHGWTVESIEPATIEVTMFTESISAWLATITRDES